MKNPIKIVTGVAVLAAMLIASLSQEARAERGSWMPIEVNIEGKLLKMPIDPVIESGTTLVPMRAIFEALGAEIKWDGNTQTVTGTKGNTRVELTIDSKAVKKNGTASQLTVAPKLVDGNTMIPLRYVSESLDMHVAWIASERQVYIAKDRPIEGTTMASIEVLFDKYTPMYDGDRFVEQPSFKAPYKAGRLADGYLQNGLKAVNLMRELAGLRTLTLDSNLNDLAQHGSVLLMATSQFTHTPDKASDMDDAFFQKGYKGTSTSNIAGVKENSLPTELYDGVRQLMIDQDTANLGHRRNLLAPSLTTIGLSYSSLVNPYNTSIKSGDVLTSFDVSTMRSADYDYVAWPSKGYFPISWLAQGTAFSVSFNPDKYQSLDTTKISGTITNAVDGSIQKLIYGQTGGFYINVEKYGEGNCISFYPYNDDKFFDQPNPGDEFTIELSGIYKTDGTPATIKYTVKLFAME